MTNIEKSHKLFRWAIGYLFHQNEGIQELIPFGFSRVVNLAFACELLIKSHLMRENNIKSGHYLENLYKKLTEDKQNFIKKSLAKVYHGTIYNDELFDFNQVLAEQSRVFIEWRYPFDKDFEKPLENKRGHYGFLYQLAKALIEKYKEDYEEFPTYNGYNPDFEAFSPDEHYKLQ